MNGFLLLDKESNWTSRDVCNKIQHIFHTKKVGHIGTLDPFATGLLIVSLGNANKASRFIECYDKQYSAKLKIGERTSTGDLSGETIETKPVKKFEKQQIIEVLQSFTGKIEQKLPMTSAVHYNGKKLYKYAHEGIIIDTPTRFVDIKSIELISYDNNIITFNVIASKGTYIRTLAEDIASRLDCCGHLISLRRIKIGNFDVSDAKKISQLTIDDIKEKEELLKELPTYICDNDMERKVRNGAIINLTSEEQQLLIKNRNGEALAVYEKVSGTTYKSIRGLW